MTRAPAELALPDPTAARRAFDRAAASFDGACAVHDEARRRLLERLEYVRLNPAWVVDLGCATGAGARALARRYPEAQVGALDRSRPMLSRLAGELPAAESPTGGRIALLHADAEQLPLVPHSVDLLLANLLLPWCRPQAVLAEAARVLRRGGLLLFSALGPDTLQQVRQAWAGIDDRVHVHAFTDMHDLGDLAVTAGLAEPVMDVDRVEVTYRDARAMALDLRACGGVNTAPGRRRTLTAPGRWRRFEEALHAGRGGGRFPVTVELVLGHAWGTGAALPVRRDDPSAEVRVPVEHVGRRTPPP